VLIPVANAGGAAPTAPTITFVGGAFTQQGSVINLGNYTPASPSLYDGTGTGFVPGVIGNSSMNATNLFGANEQAAFGGTPNHFVVYEYTFTPAIQDNTPYELKVTGAGSPLPAGTFLAAAGVNGSEPFSTPYTVAGLVNGPGCTDCGPQGGPVPEPSSLVLLGSGIIGLAAWGRKRIKA
jgi:hypothetical protein